MKTKIIYLSVALFTFFLYLAANPIHFSKNKFENTNGIVSRIYSGGVNDIVFELKNNTTTFYINRGLENNFNLTTLKNELVGKEVTIKYSNGWTPLDPFDKRSKNILEIKNGQKLIFKY